MRKATYDVINDKQINRDQKPATFITQPMKIVSTEKKQQKSLLDHIVNAVSYLDKMVRK